MDRDWVGYDPDVSHAELFEQNRGIWHLGRRARDERYATFSFEGTIVAVAEITDVVTLPWRRPSTRREKQAVVGRALAPGHPAFGRFIGQPVAGHRNPVSYIRDPEGADHAERRAFHYIYIYIYMNLAPVLCPGETNHEVEALVKAALRLTPGIRQPATGRSPRRGASCA